MKLNFRKFGSGHPLFILHGVFGSSDNWQTLGKEFAENFEVYLIDQRNHGDSPHDEEMNYKAMSEDLAELMEDENLSSIFLLGHSMGGKTAMHLACDHEEKVDKLIVVDISPVVYPPHHQQIFEGFHAVNLPSLQSRKDADLQMAEKISDLGVRQFILKNLTRDKNNNYTWKINLDVLERNIENIGAGLSEGQRFEKPTLFIGGSKSNYINNDTHAPIKRHFPSSEIKMIAGSGHWIHAEKPEELAQLVVEFLS